MKEQELEFRAWDRAAQVMHYNVMTDGKSVIAKYRIIGNDDPLLEPEIYSLGQPGLFIIMEYTGSMDVNNKKIFDGDKVIKISHGREVTGHIEWSHEASQWWIRTSEKQYIPLTPDFGDGQYYCQTVEVVGNIYE